LQFLEEIAAKSSKNALDMLKYLSESVFKLNGFATAYAAYVGNLDVLDWVHATHQLDSDPWDGLAIALECGESEYALALMTKYLDFEEFPLDARLVFSRALGSCMSEQCLQLFMENVEFKMDAVFCISGFCSRFEGKKVQLQYWQLLTKYGLEMDDAVFVNSPYGLLPVMNHETLSFLHGLGFLLKEEDLKGDPEYGVYNNRFFTDHLLKLSGLKYIHEHFQDLVTEELLGAFIQYGNTPAARFLIRNNIEFKFKSLIKYNCVDLAEEIYTKNPNIKNLQKYVDKHSDDCRAACEFFEDWDGWQWMVDKDVKLQSKHYKLLLFWDQHLSYLLFMLINKAPLPSDWEQMIDNMAESWDDFDEKRKAMHKLILKFFPDAKQQ
jgi:hypothetical protein